MATSTTTGEEVTTPRGWRFNPSVEWQEFVAQYEQVISAIVAKYCADAGLRPDARQEARIALYTTFPEQVRGYEAFKEGKLSQDRWDGMLDRYLRNVIRNAVLSMLDSWSSGPWYIGRTRPMKDPRTGERKKVHVPPRYERMSSIRSPMRVLSLQQTDVDPADIRFPDPYEGVYSPSKGVLDA